MCQRATPSKGMMGMAKRWRLGWSCRRERGHEGECEDAWGERWKAKRGEK